MTSQDVFPVAGGNPEARLNEDDLTNLKVVVADTLADDTRLAMEQNFPPEQLPDFDLLKKRMQQGFVALHELRCATSNELLSSRMIVEYEARERGDVQFLLISFVVTPDGSDGPDSRQSKSKGYGSYLRQKSYDISRRQKPHAFGLVAERESPKGAESSAEQRVRRASWMARLGLSVVDDLIYDIPPLVHNSNENKASSATGITKVAYVPVAEREGPTKAADLIVSRFDKKKTISGKVLKTIVGRLYNSGYNIDLKDPFYVDHLAAIDVNRDYELIGA